MQEGGRSIVWQAVDEVLQKYSRQGLIGTREKDKIRIKRNPDWIPGMGEEFLGGVTSGPSVDAFRSALSAGSDKGDGEIWRGLHQWLIDDIAAEISAAIEARLAALEAAERARRGEGAPLRPAWLRVLTGGGNGTDMESGSAGDAGSDGSASALDGDGPSGAAGPQAADDGRGGPDGPGGSGARRFRVVSSGDGSADEEDLEADGGGDRGEADTDQAKE
jgi:hypothetical protein